MGRSVSGSPYSAPKAPNAPQGAVDYSFLSGIYGAAYGRKQGADFARPTNLVRKKPKLESIINPNQPKPDTGVGGGSGNEGIFRPDVAGEESPPSLFNTTIQTPVDEVDYTALQNELNEIATNLQTDDEAFEDYLESDDYVQTTVGTGSTTMDDALADPFDETVTSGDDTPTMDEDQERLELQDELDRRTYESIIDEMQEDADGEISDQTKIDVATDRIDALINSDKPVTDEERRAEEEEIQRLQGVIEDLGGVKNYGDPSSSMDEYLAEIADQDVRDRVKFEDLLARNAESGEGLLSIREYNNLIQNRITALDESTMTVTSSQRRAEEAEIKRLQGLTEKNALEEGYAYYVEQYNQLNTKTNLNLTLGEDVFTLGDPADNPVDPTFSYEDQIKNERSTGLDLSDTSALDAPTPENYGMDSEGNLITYSDRFTYNPDRDYVKYASGEELNDYLIYKQNQSLSNTDMKPHEHFEYEQEDPFLINNEDYKRHLEWSQNNNNMGEMRYLESMYYRFKTQALSSVGDDEYNKFLSTLNLSDSPTLRNNWAAGMGMAVYGKLSRDLNIKMASSMFGSF